MMAKFNWVSSLDPQNNNQLQTLQERMKQYYSEEKSYYEDIGFTNNVWQDPSQLPQQDILLHVKNGEVLEIGCGKANILINNSDLQSRYTGIDFSKDVIANNKNTYPNASFDAIEDIFHLPFSDSSFDVVFSHFVLEHTVYPHIFLKESLRILKPGGSMIILCPEFLGHKYIPSQRVGLSQGSGRDKFKRKNYLDAILTGIDSRIWLPLQVRKCKKQIRSGKGFFINLDPTCFSDSYYPDMDAVYITDKSEIKTFLSSHVQWQTLSVELEQYCNTRRLIYCKGIKK